MSDVLQLDITVKKSHVAVLSVVVLVASASAAVNVRDPMNVFGDLNVRGGELDMHQNEITNTTEIEFSSDYLKDYANTEGRIDTEGASQAAADYFDGEISYEQLRTVETFFFNEVPVKNNVLEEYDDDNSGQLDVQEVSDASADFIDGELSEGEINLIQYYFLNEVPITEPASSIDAAKITSSGKLIASGIIGRQKANFTIGNDINMQGNNIYNAGNLNTGTGGGGGLEWDQLYQVSDSSSTEAGFDGETVTASVSCDTGDVLVSATCERGRDTYTGEGYVTINTLVKCDARSRDEAVVSKSGQEFDDISAAVTGTCVPGGQQAKTDTVTIDASGQTGAVETYQLDREYDNVVKVEWTGGGIQPADASGDDPGPPAEGFGDDGTPWFIYVVDSSSGSQSTVASPDVEIKPSDGLGQIDSPEWYGYPPDTEPEQPNGDRNPVYKLPDGSQMQNNYVKEFASRSVDSVKLKIPADHHIATDSDSPTVGEFLGQLDWTGSEEIKITYYPEN